jgi:hypothetical protein
MNDIINSQIFRVWLIWFFTRGLDLCKMGFAALGISASPNTPERMADFSIAFIITVAHWAISFYNTRKAVKIPSPTPTTIGGNSAGKSLALIGLLLFASQFTTGCISVPHTYTDPTTGATVTYSPTDYDILYSCATIENSLPEVRIGASVATKLILTNLVKQSSTQARDGAYIWSVSGGLYGLTSGNLITPSDLASRMTSFGANNSDIQSGTDIAGLMQNFSGVYTSVFNQLNEMASKTSNPNVKAVIVKTSIDLIHALAGGAQDATAQYAPSTSTTDALKIYEWFCYYLIRPREDVLGLAA